MLARVLGRCGGKRKAPAAAGGVDLTVVMNTVRFQALLESGRYEDAIEFCRNQVRGGDDLLRRIDGAGGIFDCLQPATEHWYCRPEWIKGGVVWEDSVLTHIVNQANRLAS